MRLRDLLRDMPARSTVYVYGRKVVRTPTGGWYIRSNLDSSAFTVTDHLDDAIKASMPDRSCSWCHNVETTPCGYCGSYEPATE